jgi:hypothetical protein
MPPPPVPSPPTITRPARVYQGGTYTSEEPTQTTTTLPGPNPVPRQSSAFGSPPVGTARVSSRGTVYGGQTGQPTSANADAPLEESGSLTGMILSRGTSARFQPEPRKSRLRGVIVTTIGIVVFIGAIGALVYALAGDFLRSLLHTLIHLQ